MGCGQHGQEDSQIAQPGEIRIGRRTSQYRYRVH
jgi:hypothetical protein